MVETGTPLTDRQRRILLFLRQYVAVHHYAPSLREIGDGAGVSSKAVVWYNLEQLSARGYLRRARGCSRAIGLLEKAYAV